MDFLFSENDGSVNVLLTDEDDDPVTGAEVTANLFTCQNTAVLAMQNLPCGEVGSSAPGYYKGLVSESFNVAPGIYLLKIRGVSSGGRVLNGKKFVEVKERILA